MDISVVLSAAKDLAEAVTGKILRMTAGTASRQT
jgi:hypothetical protein